MWVLLGIFFVSTTYSNCLAFRHGQKLPLLPPLRSFWSAPSSVGSLRRSCYDNCTGFRTSFVYLAASGSNGADDGRSEGGSVGGETRRGGGIVSVQAEDINPRGPTKATIPTKLTEEQKDFCRGYLNKHHSDLVLRMVEVLTPVGQKVAKANVWSGGSMAVKMADIESVDEASITIRAVVQKRKSGQMMEDEVETLTVPLDSNPIPEKIRQFPALPLVPDDGSVDPDKRRWPIDDWCRRVARLCWILKMPEVSGKLVQLALQLRGGVDKNNEINARKIGELPPNLYLNQVPHNRYVRQYFYDEASEAVLEAVVLCSQGKISNRMKVLVEFPELNPSMDSYRIGTLLELVRAVAIRLAEENVRVRVCVQQSMGVGIFTGLPKQLGGVARLLQLMDWQSNEGEPNEGMVGTYVNFGAVGSDHVQNEVRDADGNIVKHADDVFLLVAPQSMVGTDSSILPFLQEMLKAAGDRPVILINPDLTDKVSSAGQQSVRGRQERLDVAQSFELIHCFQNIYVSGTSYFPILGAMTKSRQGDPWVAHQRRDLAGDGGELYVPILMSETRPGGQVILESFER
jgi:adenylate kinase